MMLQDKIKLDSPIKYRAGPDDSQDDPSRDDVESMIYPHVCLRMTGR